MTTVGTALAILQPELLSFILGMFIGLVFLLLLSVFFKNTLAHDPNKPFKLAWFIEIPKNRSVVINRGGRPTHTLRGDEGPSATWAFLGLWMLYKLYVMKVTGYHVYFPFFSGPTVYDLPRYRVREEGGKKVYEVVKKDDKGYRSNHVRTEPTTWYFEYAGAEIQKIPFIIKGSGQIRIPKGEEENALYKTDSWNVLLDQALNSVIRSVVRKDLTLDMVIGGVENDLWGSVASVDDPYTITADLIMARIAIFKIGELELSEIIKIDRVDIIDFEDQLEGEEIKSLRAATLMKEQAKGKELEGRAEAANIERAGKATAEAIKAKGTADAAAIRSKGTATAGAQAELVEIHVENPELASDIIQADALRAFAQNGGGIIDAVAASFLKGGTKK